MTTNNSFSYLHGLGNHHESEALPGALPGRQHSPQQVPYHLYAEQINGNSFTTPRFSNLKAWQYRLRPSVLHSGNQPNKMRSDLLQGKFTQTPPAQMRWAPISYKTGHYNIFEGSVKYLYNGTVGQDGCAIYLYTATASMKDQFFINHDAEMLFIPQEGELIFKTEFGRLNIKPGDIAVLPRGVCFQVELLNDKARGYWVENYGQVFTLLSRGVIGANGTTEELDFRIPVAWYEERSGDFTMLRKFNGHVWEHAISHSPLDVVAWCGTYYPYQYDLSLFKPMFTASIDHPDPSIFVVLSSPSLAPGTSNLDFIIFPERWMVADHTFRPPYYHRNAMSEFMGNIRGAYDAKEHGFLPGGASLHNCMLGHGPDTEAYDHAIKQVLKPQYYEGNLAFMLESNKLFEITAEAYESPLREMQYQDCWKDLKLNFKK